MDAASARNRSLGSSLICGGLGAFGAISSAWGWATSGHASLLIGAAAFALITPAWYLRPLSFTSPLRQELTRRREPLPKWAQACSIGGFILLWASLAVRWAT